MERKMDLENVSIKTKIFIKDNGKMIYIKDMVNIPIMMLINYRISKISSIKDNGKMD
jgi:hypothetical protein